LKTDPGTPLSKTDEVAEERICIILYYLMSERLVKESFYETQMHFKAYTLNTIFLSRSMINEFRF
jgi:hypothetical protein